MNLTIDLENYNSGNSVFRRTAARGIIRNGNLYLLIYSKYGDYKFPGGGVEIGETLEETVIREVQEETGFQVIRSSIKDYGIVHERRKGKYDDLLEMDSHYFICDVEIEAGKRNLDEYEKEYDYQIVWMTLQEAIKRNNQVSDLETCPWVIRDTKVMEYLSQEQFIQENRNRA
jgi:8-oxo-dGTP pyrophosphatase MutT (NUDIX family)